MRLHECSACPQCGRMCTLECSGTPLSSSITCTRTISSAHLEGWCISGAKSRRCPLELAIFCFESAKIKSITVKVCFRLTMLHVLAVPLLLGCECTPAPGIMLSLSASTSAKWSNRPSGHIQVVHTYASKRTNFHLSLPSNQIHFGGVCVRVGMLQIKLDRAVVRLYSDSVCVYVFFSSFFSYCTDFSFYTRLLPPAGAVWDTHVLGVRWVRERGCVSVRARRCWPAMGLLAVQ